MIFTILIRSFSQFLVGLNILLILSIWWHIYFSNEFLKLISKLELLRIMHTQMHEYTPYFIHSNSRFD